jgi:hypothetical protein
MIRILRILHLFGFDALALRNTILYFPKYLRQYIGFLKQRGKDPNFKMGALNPVLGQHKEASGLMSGHYFHQDLLVARRIYHNKPIKHVDIGSRTDGFVAHVATFRELEIIDIRPQTSHVKNIIYLQADLMEDMTYLKNYCDSVSALHSLEHFGLGRYGDPINYNGFVKGFQNIAVILKQGGKFFFSVPIGPQRVEFNAHRVFSIKYLLDIIKETYSVDSFSFVDDIGEIHENVELDDHINSNFGCHYGCGIFELTKL